MNIQQYINTFPVSERKAVRDKMASELSVSRSTVKSWANGNRSPRRQLILRIVKLSNGKINAEDLMS